MSLKSSSLFLVGLLLPQGECLSWEEDEWYGVRSFLGQTLSLLGPPGSFLNLARRLARLVVSVWTSLWSWSVAFPLPNSRASLVKPLGTLVWEGSVSSLPIMVEIRFKAVWGVKVLLLLGVCLGLRGFFVVAGKVVSRTKEDCKGRNKKQTDQIMLSYHFDAWALKKLKQWN